MFKMHAHNPAERHTINTEQLLATLRYNFNHEHFRPNQLEAIKATIAGRDTLLIMPTGGGKSMTFQLPALAVGNCFTVVVGPLLALMKDQVEHCLDLGIDARVWNSDVSEERRKQVLSELISTEPEMRLLYTTPESLRNSTLRSYLKEAYEAGTLLSFAIDEAHCVSDWGHDFRPAYLELASLRDDFPETPIAAMTASCTPVVEAGIIKLLHMRDPVLIKGGFNRPNVTYKVTYKELIGDGKQDEALEHLIQFIRERQGQCGIIYARLRATCDWLCSALCSADMDVGCYHAGKDAQRRRKTQQDWSTGAIDIVVATVAFGMGIDRSDVRWVVHWDAPASLEGYYQESGRAGRDGQPSESVMYIGADDLDTITKLEKGNRSGSAAAVAAFSCQSGCKRKKLMAYFGCKRGACDAALELLCDYCSQPKATHSLQQQWEQQVTRRSIQHQLKLQRQQQAEEGQQSQDDGQQAAATAEIPAADSQMPPVQQQQQAVTKLKFGVWAPARAHTDAKATICQEKLTLGSNQGNDRLISALPECSYSIHNSASTGTDTVEAASAKDEPVQAMAGTVVGIRPSLVAPGLRPQLARKRPGCKGDAARGCGAFKAPRVTPAVAHDSSNMAPGSCPAASSAKTSIDDMEAPDADKRTHNTQVGSVQMTQSQQVPSAANITAQSSPQASAELQAVVSEQAAPAPAAPAIRSSRGLGRAGRGRHAFIPPLKKS